MFAHILKLLIILLFVKIKIHVELVLKSVKGCKGLEVTNIIASIIKLKAVFKLAF